MKKPFQKLMFAFMLLAASTAVHAQGLYWNVTGGNAGTNPATDYVGTSDATPLVIRVKGDKAGRIEWSNNVANTSLGYQTLQGVTTGVSNVVFGFQALKSNTSGSYNTAMGYRSLWTNTSGLYNTGLGYQALLSNTASNNTGVGYNALVKNSTGTLNAAVGSNALANNTSGNGNVAFGSNALYTQTTSFDNTAIGVDAMYSNNSGTSNTANGRQALYSNTTGYNNVAAGGQSLYFNTTGYQNTAVGLQSLYTNTTGRDNSAFGRWALYSNTTGINNTANGSGALYFNTTGLNNEAIGVDALRNNTTGSLNAANGMSALLSNTTGNFNTGLGFGADVATGALNNATAIGANAIVCASNMMVFGDAAVTKWGFGVCPGPTDAILVGTNPTNGNGAHVTNGGAWVDASERAKKEDFTALDKKDILEKISKLEITRWKYIGTDNEYHIGPMADDFLSTFNVGDNTGIAPMDKSGIALIGIQQLSKTNDELKMQVETLQSGNQELKDEVEDLKSIMNELKSQLQSLDVSLSQCCTSHQQNKASSTDGNDIAGTQLYTITPNPFSQKATITFSLPADASNAQLSITDASGKVVSSYSLSIGATEQVINANKLAAGVYQYSLIVNGKMMDSKQMVIAK